ncbi:kinase-like domain-containing protein [Gigaspora rosea]|uniref:Kinase-like domain-containing protein n=1 Tax=Gigaspora rosea TaxID=44941 RepID=A0A397UAM6_9GLOM|nr:kinase-like domain-containing protein [Gigaspora rosea]
MGSLRKNLYKVSQMKWNKKLELLSSITLDLQLIHSNNIIHCDLHSGNIFQDNLHSAYIGDLGIAISVNKTLDKESRGIYGTLPYVAPEVLQGKPFTKASDIYSFGMIMWEISSGNFVFSDYKNNDSSLAIEICFKELRPNILKAIEVHETILKWKNSTEILADFLRSDENMEIEDNGFDNVEDSTIYTSQFISYINQQSSECIITDEIFFIKDIEKLSNQTY